ncbi:thioredoxin [Thioclava dalianensis]|uniref:Thioredoxin n=1 Tax=Thioclava dalianensis TaxID=1185766 RepID=A0A074TDI6_9RHOB|nr:tetratricopeptide repeat protein [Thioclava dalianensis]KEP68225.1 thioredoxin [Thioclava dalianensis]SFM92130.1 putative thioredoxin [Thioclava dalianensis]
MLELGGTQDATPANDLIKDVTEADFMAEVIEKSQTVPVIVDFWAPWCGPCKQLGPAIESEVVAAKGAVVLAKVNVDENQMIAGQLRVQSIPTVYAFWQGQPVDGFQGALPASEVKAFVAKVAEMGPGADNGLADALEAAEAMLAEGEAEDAAETFAAIIEEDPDLVEAHGGLIRARVAQGDLDAAGAALAAVPPKLSDAGPVEAARAQYDLAKQAQSAGPLDELKAKVEADATDHQARFDYAQALYAAGEPAAAVDQLLELFRRDREWDNEAAKTQLFTIFDALKPSDPIVQAGRRRLSSMIFA